MQLAYLHTLLSAKLITENEYSRIRKKLQKDYKVNISVYTDGPYVILENNIDNVAEEFKPKVLFLLNEGNE